MVAANVRYHISRKRWLGYGGIWSPWRFKLDELDLKCGCGVPRPRSWNFTCVQLSQLASHWVARLSFILKFFFFPFWIAIKKFLFSSDTPQESLLLATFSASSSSSSPVSD